MNFLALSFLSGFLSLATHADALPEFQQTSQGKYYLKFQGITGGGPASGEDYPFFALLFADAEDDTSYFCGGSLIKEDKVLTAAHCVDFGDPARVRIGPSTNVDGESILVIDTQIHPKYTGDSTLKYDFAVLTLATPSTAPVVILNEDVNFPEVADTPLKTIGYGTTENDEPSPFLKQVDLVYVPFDTCVEQYFNDLTRTLHVCVDGAIPEEAPCAGDSGGPLLFEETLAIGVLSFGVPCGAGFEGADVYAKIADNFEWIAATAGFPGFTPSPTTFTPAPSPAPSGLLTSEPTYESPTTPSPTEFPTITAAPTDLPVGLESGICSYVLLWIGDVWPCLGR